MQLSRQRQQIVEFKDNLALAKLKKLSIVKKPDSQSGAVIGHLTSFSSTPPPLSVHQTCPPA
jgi:hypothetical protein